MKGGVRHCAGLIAAVAMAAHANQTAVRGDAWSDTSGHRPSFVTVAAGVDVEVLDWQGSGPVIFLLAGLNNTAHVRFNNEPRHAHVD